jgi:iron complex outermembrane receptor protein
MGIAYTYGQDLEREEPLPEIAPLDFRYSLQGSYFNDHLKPGVLFRYVLEQNRISEEFGETATPGFALLDVKVTYHASSQWQFTGGINNLLNRNYYEHLNRSVRSTDQPPLFAPGRNIFVSFNYSFN